MFMSKRLARNDSHTAIVAACLCLIFTATTDEAVADISADVLAPRRPEPLPLRIADDADSPIHRIVIPKAVLAKLAGDAPAAAGIASDTPVQSIMAAITLSAAVACGLVASRRGRTGRLAAVALCGLAVAGAGGLLVGGQALADLAAPDGSTRQRPRPRPRADGPESVTLAQGGRVILELTDQEDDTVVLVVGKPAPAAK